MMPLSMRNSELSPLTIGRSAEALDIKQYDRQAHVSASQCRAGIVSAVAFAQLCRAAVSFRHN